MFSLACFGVVYFCLITSYFCLLFILRNTLIIVTFPFYSVIFSCGGALLDFLSPRVLYWILYPFLSFFVLTGADDPSSSASFVASFVPRLVPAAVVNLNPACLLF